MAGIPEGRIVIVLATILYAGARIELLGDPDERASAPLRRAASDANEPRPPPTRSDVLPPPIVRREQLSLLR